MKLFESLKNKKFLLFNIFFTLYIAINLIGGERGLISYFDKKNTYEELIEKDKKLIPLEGKIRKLLSNILEIFFLRILKQSHCQEL